MAYIKMQDVMKICESYSEHCFNSNDARGQDVADRILDDVVELPTADVVEVPCRCGDCKNYNDHRYCTYFATTVLDDDFCSYGERKDT